MNARMAMPYAIICRPFRAGCFGVIVSVWRCHTLLCFALSGLNAMGVAICVSNVFYIRVMPQSLTKMYVHIVFGTKHREPTIKDEIQDELYRYIGKICSELECYPIQIGGYYDHVHILCVLSKKITLITLLEEVKKNSSKWIKTKGDDYGGFYWQGGYAAFSVGSSELERLISYIRNQREHHSKLSYQDECRKLFKRYGVDFDEKYVWD
jgi:putative transposase